MRLTIKALKEKKKKKKGYLMKLVITIFFEQLYTDNDNYDTY